MPARKNAFTPEVLQAIFNKPAFTAHEIKSPSRFWIPLIGLFSGMHLQEIFNLRCDDINLVSDIWCFTVTDTSSQRKKIKVVKATRQVPVHSALLNLGFITYFEEIKKTGAVFLFPELVTALDKLYDATMYWFTYYIFTIANTKKTYGSFHDLRIYFASFYAGLGYPTAIVSALIGYGTPNPPNIATLKKAVDLFHPGFDICNSIKPWLPETMLRIQARKQVRTVDRSLQLPDDSLDSIASTMMKPKRRI